MWPGKRNGRSARKEEGKKKGEGRKEKKGKRKRRIREKKGKEKEKKKEGDGEDSETVVGTRGSLPSGTWRDSRRGKRKMDGRWSTLVPRWRIHQEGKFQIWEPNTVKDFENNF